MASEKDVYEGTVYAQAYGSGDSDGNLVGPPHYWKVFDEKGKELCRCHSEAAAMRIVNALATEETKAY